MAAERSTAASLRQNTLGKMWGKFKPNQNTHKQNRDSVRDVGTKTQDLT